MIKIYNVSDAQKTILNRAIAMGANVPDAISRAILTIFGSQLSPQEAVSRLISEVRRDGDDALQTWTARIDGITLPSLVISKEEIDKASARLSPGLYDALQSAADRIRRFHQLQPIPEWTTHTMGGTLGQRFTPIERIGVYVPGGSAPLPSSLLMSVIPAQVAGVSEIILTTPPGRLAGKVPDVILAAVKLVGIDAIYTIGGALAIAAMAFGTETIPQVDKIVGPGNLFTTIAKQQVYGIVGIDGLYGPTETLVVADDSANPEWVAADLLAQAEHDVLASAILLTPSQWLAESVQAAVANQVEDLSRAETISISLSHRGGIVITADLDEACRLASDYAAEHTCLIVRDANEYKDKILHAGGLFIGERSFEVLGDYIAGPSHVMPTGGSARFSSPLNVLDFMKISSIVQLDDETSAKISPTAARIALAEELTAHANAALKRVKLPSDFSRS